MENKEVLTAALTGLLHDVARRHDTVSELVPILWQEKVNSFPAGVLTLADQLSTGASQKPKSHYKHSASRLLSVFSLIETQEGEQVQKAPESFYWPIKSLSMSDEKSLFPVADVPASETQSSDEEQLWKELRNQIQTLKEAHEENGNLEIYLESLLLLLQRYTWCLPSACYPDMPSVSLYDHSRMAAALAAILIDSLTTDKIEAISRAPEQSEEDVALLVGGDLSGVQDFIYTITNKGATSVLRGRSFYLQLLTEAAARYILRRLELPITNLIYAGGGNFYLLARPTDIEKLNQEIRPEVSRILYRYHQGDLYLAVESLELRAKDFVCPKEEGKRHPLSEKWNELAQKLTLAKNRRFSELEAEELEMIFKPLGHGGIEDTSCKACGQEFPEKEYETVSSDGEEVKVCQSCYSYYDLGKDLRKAEYLILEIQKLETPENLTKVNFAPQKWRETMRAFGLNVATPQEFGDSATGNPQIVLALNEEALEKLQPARNRAIGRRLLVNVAPRLSSRELEALKNKGIEDLPDEVDDSDPPIKPFGALAAQSQGIKRFGILRMDVDNLGRLFAEGLGEYAALSRIASLSFAVSLYFEGWVGELAKRRNQARREADTHRKDDEMPRGDGIYAIYSGGDDLFFVGAWDEIVELAREIRRDLTKYAANHPGIHASGGIVLVNDKYPLAKAAEDCHRAEQAAKGLKWWQGEQKKEKDVITFLGLPMPWVEFGIEDCSPETGTAHSLMHLLVEMDDQAVFRTLLNNYANYAEAEETRRKQGEGLRRDLHPQPLYGPWNWRVFYTLRRKLKEHDNKKLSQLADHLRTTPEAMSKIGLAARWAELIIRK